MRRSIGGYKLFEQQGFCGIFVVLCVEFFRLSTYLFIHCELDKDMHVFCAKSLMREVKLRLLFSEPQVSNHHITCLYYLRPLCLQISFVVYSLPSKVSMFSPKAKQTKKNGARLERD